MYYENRVIAMLDVLGMANQLTNKESLIATTKKYSELIQEAQKNVLNQTTIPGSKVKDIENFAFAEFVFDTIVLVSHPITVHSTAQFITGISNLMGLFFKNKMPLRGSIGIGDYLVDKETNVFLSNIFKKLNNDELNQEWSGCCILPDAVDIILDNITGSTVIDKDNQLQSNIFHLLNVPMKENKNENRLCINWYYSLIEQETKLGLEYMIGNKIKYDNTKEYIQQIKLLKDEYQILDETFLPATRLRVMKTRANVRIIFTDDNDIPVEPNLNDKTIEIYK